MPIAPLALALLLSAAPLRAQEPALHPASADELVAFLRALLPGRQARIGFELTIAVKQGENNLTLKSAGVVQTAPKHKMRSRVTFSPPLGMSAGTYEMVSDGATVWVRDLNAKTWMRQTFREFDNGNDDSIFLTGFFAGISAQVTESFTASDLQKIESGRLTDAERKEIEADIAKGGAGDVTVGEESVDGKSFQVFALKPADKPGIQVKLLVDPKSGKIDRLVIAGLERNMNLSMTEKVLSLSPLAPTATTFTFVPQGKQVKKISLGDKG